MKISATFAALFILFFALNTRAAGTEVFYCTDKASSLRLVEHAINAKDEKSIELFEELKDDFAKQGICKTGVINFKKSSGASEFPVEIKENGELIGTLVYLVVEIETTEGNTLYVFGESYKPAE
ncbi:hypothetical protein L0Y49_04995 [bacterium]|nr:hypothetical protein [bacterium]MCI0566164.1 hypothetical protein [bacterium]MCI0679995.1 hypothetical protein [bacterium]